MLNNFIGGGQVFLHKMRMLKQVISTCIFVSLVSGILLTLSFGSSKRNNVDWNGAITYTKAQVAVYLHPVLSKISLGESRANVDAYSSGRLWKKNMLANSVLSSYRFKEAIAAATTTVKILAFQAFGFGFLAGLMVFLFRSRFGKELQDDKRKEGSGVVLSAKEVRSKLKRLGKCSDLYIGDMPLVKNMETRHFLVTGSTGSGKANLIHTLLSQIERKRQPVIVIDRTGEMIAKYYNPEHSDIIFNPFDVRSTAWDFWADCSTREDLERFSKILIGFNRKQSESHSDPFWENAATTVFNACIEFLRPQNASIEQITHMVHSSDLKYLRASLADTEAGRYLSDDSKQTASSIISVLSSNTKPLTYLKSSNEMGSFSMRKHFVNIQNGSSAWLFLATKPSSRI
jgi:type IV secretory pathway TraG/TraD family ATPase VirD4